MLPAAVRLGIGVGVSVGAMLLGGVPAEATCASSSCFLLPRAQDGLSEKGFLSLDLSYRYVNQSRLLSGTSKVNEVLSPKIEFEHGEIALDHHSEVRTQSRQLVLDMTHGLTDRLTLVGSLPLVNDRDHEHYDGEGERKHFTRQDGTTGLGDLQIGARLGAVVDPLNLLVAGVTVKLPTGPHRLRDHHGAINEPTLQPGTGSTDLVASVLYVRQTGSIEAFASTSYRVNTGNDLEYRFGNELVSSAGAGRRTGRTSLILQLNLRHTGRDSYRSTSVPSTGATFLHLTPGVRFDASPATSFYAHVQVPIYQEVNEAQLAPRAGLVLGMSRSFD